MEQVKQIKDTNYFISSEGNLYRKLSLDIDYEKHRVRGKVNGNTKLINRLVYEAFRGSIPRDMMVAHKNGCFTMNDIGNLILVARKGRRGAGNNHHKVINVKKDIIYSSTYEASKREHLSRPTITNICNGKPSVYENDLYWYCDVNGKAFRGDYKKYMERMHE